MDWFLYDIGLRRERVNFSTKILIFKYKFYQIKYSGVYYTAQKLKFFIKDFFTKCDQIRNFLRVWSHLLKKSLMENFTFFLQCYLKTLVLIGI